jgi:cytochrome P450
VDGLHVAHIHAACRNDTSIISNCCRRFQFRLEGATNAHLTLVLRTLMQVITETLRLGNIINGIMRKAVRDVEICGRLVPKGWRVLVYFRGVHLDAAVHNDPHAFNPWRWKDRTDVATGSGGGGTFTPFGGGQRLCPGVDLARLEASIFLHHLVTSFR